MSLENLQKILTKDPIIHTYKSNDLIKDPGRVEEMYSLHADTHMSLANTNEYLNRISTCLVTNKSTFVGGVTGDYGLGKTSILVYLWRQLSSNDILAIPPYWWDDFNDNFKCIYAWTKHVLSKINQQLIDDLDEIYKKYTEPSLEHHAHEMSKSLEINYNKAYGYARGQFESGKLKLELRPEDLLSFLSDLTSQFVEKEKLFKGIVVFQDELQRTVEKNTLDNIAGILFDLSSSLCASEGKYGMIFGMPIQTQAALAAERSDIFDRLEKFKCFISLEDMYGVDFALQLWKQYSVYFQFADLSDGIVEPTALMALGQITDSKRKDLGNGPRSVISAFNRIIFHYEKEKRTYTVIDLVNDCLDLEITLGERSTYIKRVNNILEMPFANEDLSMERCIKVFAGFPKGCSNKIVSLYELRDELHYLIKNAYGEIIKEVPEGYVLVTLLEFGLKQSQSIIDNRFMQFRNKYSPDKKNIKRAKKTFINKIIPAIFHDWKDKDGSQKFKWNSNIDNNYFCDIQGGFNKKYPKRILSLFVGDFNEADIYKSTDSHFSIFFNLKCNKLNSEKNSIMIDDKLNKVIFNIDLLKFSEDLSIPLINSKFIHRTLISPLFCLALINYLDEESDIPKSEFETKNSIVRQLIDKLVVIIFNEEMKKVQGIEQQFNNSGKYIIVDVFDYICRQKYPNYSTLIVSEQWESRLGKYIAILQNENISLNAKRGKEPIVANADKKNAKKDISNLLGISPSTLDTWANTFRNLIDITKLDTGEVWLKIHPLEEKIIDMIEESNKSIKKKGVQCNSVKVYDVFKYSYQHGYLNEEIIFIMKSLGSNRKYFKFEGKGPNSLIYRMPVSVDELRSTLIDKLNAVEMEFDNLKTLNEFDKVFNLDEVKLEINQMNDEETYEKIKCALHAQFEINHHWIKVKMDQWITNVQNQQNSLDILINNFERGEFSIITRKLSSNAKWVNNIYEIQSVNLKHDINSIKQESSTITELIKNAIQIRDNTVIPKIGAKDIIKLDTIISNANEINENVMAEFKVLSQDIKNLRKWHNLAQKSHEIFDKTIRAKELGEDQSYNQYQNIEDEVILHLKKLGKQGLKNYEAFKNKYQKLEEEANNFLLKARKVFRERCQYFANFIDEIGGDKAPVLKSIFEESNPNQPYERLYNETTKSINKTLYDLNNRIKSLENEIEYLEKILDKKVDIKQICLDVNIKELSEIMQNCMREDIGSMVKNQDFQKLADSIAKINNDYLIYRREYLSLLMPQETDEKEQSLLKHLDTTIDKDLKEVILRIGKEDPKSFELDRALDLIKSLFKKNQLTIKIKKRA